MQKKHSRYSIASFIVGLAAAVLYYPGFLVVLFFNLNDDPQALPQIRMAMTYLHLAFMTAVVASIGLGVTGQKRPNSKVLFSILGYIVCGIALVEMLQTWFFPLLNDLYLHLP
jgi:hypothetical protein